MWPLRYHLEKILMRCSHLINCGLVPEQHSEHWCGGCVTLSSKWPSAFLLPFWQQGHLMKLGSVKHIHCVLGFYSSIQTIQTDIQCCHVKYVFKNISSPDLKKKCLEKPVLGHCISKNISCLCQQLSTQSMLSVPSTTCTVLHLWSQLLKGFHCKVTQPPKRITWPWHTVIRRQKIRASATVCGLSGCTMSVRWERCYQDSKHSFLKLKNEYYCLSCPEITDLWNPSVKRDFKIIQWYDLHYIQHTIRLS